ncbi:N-6 DNA methylase [Acidovorax sp. SUPP2522]|uniref:N-6 DNA methylase n=1 Tax=unclassified Acidovorax TaxID=2684926 RepID=UPI00234970FF|nr:MULTISPECIES: N-6 DNA methylase [unclassified Acidovorax]WCM97920.1 type I restriction-modification system subunit M [Acidovorax sp. GBBC 1281]GKT16400.1 N-6 DNA methylase [Acidovorax sp. SUPP2522]
MLDAQAKRTICHALWRCFDSVRGVADVGEARDHLLALLVLKYASDRTAEEASHAILPSTDGGSAPSFEQLLNAKHMPDIGQRIDRALAELEKQHPLLHDAFHSVRFDSSLLGEPKQRQHLIADLLSCFGLPEFDFRGGASAEVAGFACETLIKEAAAVAGKRGAEFFTPPEVSRLIAEILQPEVDESVGDPCCGSGTLLLTCSAFARTHSGGEGCRLFGQEKNGSTWALAKINMFLHGELAAQLAWGDTLKDPRLVAQGQLQTFDVVVSSPPFNVKDWGQDAAATDPYMRYRRGVPPRASADYAFISHMVETLKPGHGRMAVVVSHGVLFRSGAELQIRRQMLEEGLVDTVIALPVKLLPNTPLPIALLVLRKDKSDGRVLFIDASRQFEHGKPQNQLRDEDLARIGAIYAARADVEGYARLVSLEEILQNDCNLNVVRYVEAIEQVCNVDLETLRAERAQLRSELEGLESRFASLIQEVRRA